MGIRAPTSSSKKFGSIGMIVTIIKHKSNYDLYLKTFIAHDTVRACESLYANCNFN